MTNQLTRAPSSVFPALSFKLRAFIERTTADATGEASQGLLRGSIAFSNIMVFILRFNGPVGKHVQRLGLP